MLSMHFYLVCNMNTFGRLLAVYILVFAITGADEITSKYKSSTTTTKWKEPSTKEKSPTTSTFKQSTISTTWKQPTTSNSWKIPTSSSSWKQPTTSTSSKQRTTTTTKWNHSTTTTKSKPTTSTTSWKKLTTSKWREPTTTTKWNQPTTTKAPTKISSAASTTNGFVASASISGVDSRNGRLSMNGIKILSSDSSMVKTDDKGNFIFNSVNGKMPMPITITKQGDGVSGTIRILPGSVSVSSSASSPSKSGPTSAVASYNPWSPSLMKPIMTDVYFPPFPTYPTMSDPIFTSRIPQLSFNSRFPDPFSYTRFPDALPTIQSRMQDPWFSKDVYKKPQLKHDMMQPNWFYPNFSPFINYW